MHSIDWLEYREGLIFLFTAGVVAPIFRSLRVSPVLGFLLAGAALGPDGLGALAGRAPLVANFALTDPERISGLAELGVVFLLFMIGLELSFERLVRLKSLIFGLGALQVFGCAAILGLCALALGVGMPAAASIGAALSLSSTAVVIPSLAERKRLSTTAGRAAFSVLLFQDLMVAPLLFAIYVAEAPRQGGLAGGVAYAVVTGAAAIGILVVIGRLALRPLFHLVAKTRSTEFFVAACLLVVTAAGVASAAAGLSMSLGAFVAGLLLAETEFRREVEVTIEPFKGLLLGLFFLSVGAGLDLDRLIAHPARILVLCFGVITLKAAFIYGVSGFFHLARPTRAQIALLLGPGGEFAFVLLAAAVGGGLVRGDLAADAAIAVTLSMALIPLIAASTFRVVAARADRQAEVDLGADAADAKGHVLIIGYGRVGRLVGELMNRHELPFLAVDRNAALVASERRAGTGILYGDASRPDFLRRCGIAGAKALVVTLDNPQAAEEAVRAARRERADLTIVARARDAHQAERLYELGATDAVPETVEASLQLAEAALVDIGAPMGLVIASIHEKRDEFRKRLQLAERPTQAIRLSSRVKDLRRRGVQDAP